LPSASQALLGIYEAAKAPVCTSCNRPVKPGEKATAFPCPSCGRYEIVRCRKCKVMSVPYTCPVCGFTGP